MKRLKKNETLRRIAVISLVSVMLFALCGCDVSVSLGSAKATATPVAENTATPAPTAAPTPVPTATPIPAPTTDPATEAGQIMLIYSNLSALSADDSQTKYWYAVTDLDNNGRLELLSAVTQGTGSFTSGRFFEVNESYNGFTEIDLGLKEGEFLPEIILSSTDCYKAADGTLSYVFTDTTSSGYGKVSSAEMTLSLKNGQITLKTVYIDASEDENGYTVHSFYNGNGQEVSYEEFGKLEETAFSGLTKSTVNFDWFALAAASGPDRLAESYGKFAGKTVTVGTVSGTSAPITTVAPTAVPVRTPVPTAAPTPVPTQEIIIVRTPVVTKDPTGETLEAGKSCTFIARATDYSYMRWQLIDTYGNVYDALTNNPYPQMSIWGADGQQLTLSNVPVNMNGWSVRAVFTGNGTVYSGTAGIHVTQPKVSTPVSAYPGNGSYFYDVYNTVTLYAGTGDQIHYELIRGGDTGAYDSGTVVSGQAVNVIGIYGQCLSVELYASVVGDDGNSLHAYYTVDCCPVEPTPEPYTPAPSLNSCRGIIIDELMSTVTIDIFAGSTIQVLKDYISPAGCELMDHECTVYYYGIDPTDTSNIYSVVVDGTGFVDY